MMTNQHPGISMETLSSENIRGRGLGEGAGDSTLVATGFRDAISPSPQPSHPTRNAVAERESYCTDGGAHG